MQALCDCCARFGRIQAFDRQFLHMALEFDGTPRNFTLGVYFEYHFHRASKIAVVEADQFA